ncbi:MAG TPA: hypothetical protein ENI27_03465 [bacterium]|nr:hypothetical protein [bacterium]
MKHGESGQVLAMSICFRHIASLGVHQMSYLRVDQAILGCYNRCRVKQIMDKSTSPPVTAFLPAAFILGVAGWAGLITVIVTTLPTVGPRWLFFFLSVIALTGTILPGVAFLNRRFPSTPPPTPNVILRQAIWVGVYVPTLTWLQIARVLTPAMALLLAVGFVLVEGLLRLRERSQWKPNE